MNTEPGPNYADVECRPGVYAIYGDGVLLYVGSSENLKTRLHSHKFEWVHYSTSVMHPEWGWFKSGHIKYSYSVRAGDWLMREHRLIKRLKPPKNIRGIEGRHRRRKAVARGE